MSTDSKRDRRALLLHASVVADLLDRLLAVRLDGARLAPRAFEITTVLVTRGPLPPGEIATVTALPAPTVSRLVTRMEADGLVEQRSHPSDRRSRIVALTDAGRAAHEEAQAAFGHLYDEVVARLGEGVVVVDAAVRRLEWALRDVAGVAAPEPLPAPGPGEEVLRYPRPRLNLRQEREALDYIEWLRRRDELRGS